MTTRAGGISAGPFAVDERRRPRSATSPPRSPRTGAARRGDRRRAGLPAPGARHARGAARRRRRGRRRARCTRPMPASRPSPASPARSRSPTACRCCSPRRDGRAVGAAHAGWRGLAAGVRRGDRRGGVRGRRVRAATTLVAWLGPASGRALSRSAPTCWRRSARRRRRARRAPRFRPRRRPGKWLADLPGWRATGSRRPASRRSAAATLVHRRGRVTVLLVPPRRRHRAHGRRHLDRPAAR